MPATESKARQDLHYPKAPLCSSTTELLQNPLLHEEKIYSTDHYTGFHLHIALKWDKVTVGEGNIPVWVFFFKKSEEVPQANWSIIENGMTDWEEFKLTFMDLDLLQEGWASSKKPLYQGLKCSTY